MKFHHIVQVISNYATNALSDALYKYGQLGYQLVNVVMAQRCLYS